MNIVCFHNPDEENGYLSNWYMSEFELGGVKFSSMEQYMMYSKAKCFGDDAIAEDILKTDDVAVIKGLGRIVSNFNESHWNGVRQIIIYKGLLAKFTQNKALADKLISTDDSILAECAVKDHIWGIGLSMTDSDRLDRSLWRGQNLLGYALMLVRDDLKTNSY